MTDRSSSSLRGEGVAGRKSSCVAAASGPAPAKSVTVPKTRNIRRVSGRLSTRVHRSCVPSSMLAASALVSTKRIALSADIVSSCASRVARKFACIHVEATDGHGGKSSLEQEFGGIGLFNKED
jgi:hypothetical protein